MVTDAESLPNQQEPFRVAFTRGEGCLELASLLATDEPVRVVDDVGAACLRAQADVLVSRRLSSFDLTNQAVPHDFDPDAPERIAALVGTGPHSVFAGHVAVRLGHRLGLPVDLVTAYSSDQEKLATARALAEATRPVGITGRLVRVSDVAELIDDVGEGALLVFGAAGGRLLQRLFFGTGVRLRSKAPSGAVIVQAAPMRAFRRMESPVFVSGHMSAADAARVLSDTVVAVVDDGRLIGLVRLEALREAQPDRSVSSVMDTAVSASPEDSLEKLRNMETPAGLERIPVTDEEGLLVGAVAI